MSELFDHQVEGVERIVAEPYLWLGDELGAGKTRQAIEAGQQLYERREIDHVVVLAPAPVFRLVWADPDFGQLAEYLRVPSLVKEYRPTERTWIYGVDGRNGLRWTVTNYEFIRRSERLAPLLADVDKKTLLVLDESLAIKSPTSKTTKAVWKLRQKCGRVLLVNGTEGGGDTPADLYAQCKMMDAGILGCQNWYEFKAKYAVMGGYRALRRVKVDGKWIRRREPVQIVNWMNLDDLWRRIRPHYLRREKKDCLDLPSKLPPVGVDVPLAPRTWKLYKAMRDDAIAQISDGQVTAAQAAVKALRLAQLTSGFVGGVQDLDSDGLPYGDPALVEVGSEKLDALLAWTKARLADAPTTKFVTWCRFRAEAQRAAASLAELLPTGLIIGGQSEDERAEAGGLLRPKSAPAGAASVVGTTRAGAFGLDFAAASAVNYLSNEYSHVARTQSEERPHRPGQVNHVSYFNFIASGPDGQKTIDSAILLALRKKADFAKFGSNDWLDAIQEE